MIRPETIQAAWDAFVLAISEGATERKAMIRAIEAADEHRADLIRKIQFKYAKKDVAA
jgi:hypothetical protein